MEDKKLRKIARMLVAEYAQQELNSGYTPTGLYKYQDINGQLLYMRLRMDCPGKKKWIRPFHDDINKNAWGIGEPNFPDGKPLYLLPMLTKNLDAEVYIVEGEQKADELIKLGFTATTSGGSKSADSTNWEVLRGRIVIIWRDNDTSGLEYALTVTNILRNLGCTISYIDIDQLDLPVHGDIINWLKNNPSATGDDIKQLPIINGLERCDVVSQSLASVELLQASHITPEPIIWTWEGWLAKGKLHILAGDPSSGKTTLCMVVAAIISSGGCWPDGGRADTGNVLIWSGEDDYQDTLVPRLKQAGADMDQIYFVSHTKVGKEKRCFDPAADMELLQQEVARLGNVHLLIIDPIVSAITGDSHKNAEVRRGLQPLVDMAMIERCAVLGVTHFTKNSSGFNPVARLTGSLAFGALARVVWVAVKQNKMNEDGSTTRLLIRAKSNIGEDSGGFEYVLKKTQLQGNLKICTTQVQWSAAIPGSAYELLAAAESTDTDKITALSMAKEFLLEALSDGPILSEEIESIVKGNGYSMSTINRAKRALKIKSKKGKGDFVGKWFWKLPELSPSSMKMVKNSEDSQQNNRSIFGQNDHLHKNDDFIEVEL